MWWNNIINICKLSNLSNLMPNMNTAPKTKKRRTKKKADGFWSKLIKEDTNVSVMNFFLMATLGVGVILLFIPAVGMCVDIWFNHTLTINMSDLGAYIMAVAGIFAAGGLSSAWTEFAYSKYNVPPITEEDMAKAEYNADIIREEEYVPSMNNAENTNEENNEETE